MAEHRDHVLRVIGKPRENGSIDFKSCEPLVASHSQPGRFYRLPKIHTGGNPDRLIISGKGTLTEPISSCMDRIIGRLPSSFPSFIKDTINFLREIIYVRGNTGGIVTPQNHFMSGGNRSVN